MKTLQLSFVLLLILLITASCGTSQRQVEGSISSALDQEEEEDEDDKSQRPSPPRKSKAEISGVEVTIEYSSPAVKGRQIFGGLVPYNKVWRTGANEATVLKVEDDVHINGKLLPEGEYALFTIPGEEKWTIILNREANQWGAYSYDDELDVMRIEVQPTAKEEVTERLEINALKEGKITFSWESVSWELAVSIPDPE